MTQIGRQRFSRLCARLTCALSSMLFLSTVTASCQETDDVILRSEIDKRGGVIKIVSKKGIEEIVAVLPKTLDLLMDSRFANHMQLTESQIEAYEEMASKALKAAREEVDDYLQRIKKDQEKMQWLLEPVYAAPSNMSIGQKEFQKLLDATVKITRKFEVDVRQEILLAHQLRILDLYPVYLAIDRYGIFKILAYGPLGDSVKLRDDQRRLLEEKADEMRKKILETVARLNEEVYEEMVGVLDPEQREIVEPFRKDFVRQADHNIQNLLGHLDRSNLAGCPCDESKRQLPLPKEKPLTEDDPNMRSVLKKKDD